VVTEVTAELAQDRRHGECREHDSERRVEPVHGFHEPELGNLQEIVERLTTPGEPTSTMNGDPTMVGHDLVAQRPIAATPVLQEPSSHLRIGWHGSDDVPITPSATSLDRVEMSA
jgi:hypothetical protein